MNGMNKIRRAAAAALSVCLAAALSGCGGRGKEEKPAAPTLSPANVSVSAPDGDRSIRLERDYTVYAYLPEKNTFQLSADSRHVAEGTDLQATVDTLVQTLLDAMNVNRREGSKLSLYEGKAGNQRRDLYRQPGDFGLEPEEQRTVLAERGAGDDAVRTGRN